MKNYATCVILALCALLVAALAACSGDEKPKSFVPGPTNPFITDRFTADPAAFVDNGTVYIVCGEDTLPPSSSDYYRISRWHIYSTKDMKKFKYENVLMNSEDFDYGTANSAWASQAIKGLDGVYYFYGTVMSKQGSQAISVARAYTPTGPYKQATTTPLITSTMVSKDLQTDYENIDPTIFIDDDGTAYLSWGQVDPCIVKFKKKSMTEIERPIKHLFPEGWKSEDPYREGPFLYKRNGIYYMIYASMKLKPNGTDDAETISYAMARDEGEGLGGLIGKEGVWSDGVPITGCAPAYGEANSFTIHPAVLDFKGQTYLFYHNAMLSVKQADGSVWNGATGRRSLCVDYLYFNEDGTIQFVDVRDPAGLSVPPKK